MNRPESARWIWFLAGRVITCALLGGLAMAMVGGLLVGAISALTGWIIETGNSATAISFDGPVLLLFFGPDVSGLSLWIVLGVVGLNMGAALSPVLGVLILGASGFLHPPRRGYFPTRHVLVPVLLGLGLGIIGLTSSYYGAVLVTSQLNSTSFADQTLTLLGFLIYGLCAAMVSGAIAGAVWGWRREKRYG